MPRFHYAAMLRYARLMSSVHYARYAAADELPIYAAAMPQIFAAMPPLPCH